MCTPKIAIVGLGTVFVFCTATRSQEAKKPGDVQTQVRELLRAAIKDLNLVEDPNTKFKGLSQSAVLLARSGDEGASLRSFQSAKEILDSFMERGGFVYSRLLAQYYARANNVGEVKKIIEILPPPRPGYHSPESAKGGVVRDCALELAKVGNDKDALELAKTVTFYKPGEVRDEVLREIALHHAEARDWKAVQTTVASISTADAKIQALAGVTSGNVQDFALELPDEPGIAFIQDKQGDRAGAQKTLSQALDLANGLNGPDRAKAWASILCMQARLGDLTDAQKSLAQIPTTSSLYAMALAAIAKAQGAAGQEQAALATADKIAPLRAKLDGLAQVVVGLAQSGNMRAARAVADKTLELAKAAPEQQRRTPLMNLVRARALSKDFEGAFKTAAATSEVDQSRAYPSIAYWQGVHGDIKGALKTLDEHRALDESAWLRNFEQIAYYQAQHGQVKEALAWIRQQTAPEVRAFGLMGVAKGLLETASPAQKRQ